MNAWPTGFYPFWFWNDRLSVDEIRWQIREMAAQGVRGFFIHPRQGLGQPYLAEAFWEMVDAAVAEAQVCGLAVHLYDEYPYPSGVAGGEVILGAPEYHATQLVQRIYDLSGEEVRLELPRGQVLSCMAYPVREENEVDWTRGVDLRPQVGMLLIDESYVEMGLTMYNRKRYFASGPTPVLEAHLPPGLFRLFVSVQVEVRQHKYWDHYVDVLNEQAVQRYITLTHERYRRRYEHLFGRAIHSIFTDEVCPHWSARVPAAFQATYGYDLCAALPALQDERHPDHLSVAHDLYRLVYQMFCEAFEVPVSSWCRAHGLLYTGEKPSLRLAQLRYMDVPGCEPGHVKVGARLDLLQPRPRGNAKATASAAYLYGKPGSLCECYHSTGWSATLQDAKYVADGLLLMGITYLVPHGFFYSTHSLKKHDAPPTFFFQMPFWPLFGSLSAYVDRIGRSFEGTHIDAQVLVVEPAAGMPAHEDLEVYEALLWALMGQHIDFHLVDTDILEQGQITAGVVHVADITARMVIVPPMRVVETSLRDWLDRYQAAGGRVLWVSRDGSPDVWIDRVLDCVRPSLHVQVGGHEASEVLVVQRTDGERRLWFALHTGARSIDATLHADGPLREISLDGRPALLRQGEGGYRRQIAPYESFLLEAGQAPMAEALLLEIQVPGDGPAAIRPLRPNLLRMGEWVMSLYEGETFGPETQVHTAPLPNQLEEGGFCFSPRYSHRFGQQPELSLPALTVRYRYSFQCAYQGPVELVMEPGSIAGDWVVSVNGHVIQPGEFQPSSAHVRGSLGVDVSTAIARGLNVIEVRVTTDRLDGGLLNPLYLAGEFGVALDPVRLVPRPDQGLFEDYERNLLPYYSGELEYTTSFTLPEVPAADHVLVALVYERPFHEATSLSINDSPPQPVLWQPRCWQIATHYLCVGKNTLRTRVYTTQIRAFEGQWFDYVAHQYRQVGEQIT